nr:MAG TPA: hypothetical protein [Caudoviricetes sp.]
MCYKIFSIFTKFFESIIFFKILRVSFSLPFKTYFFIS